MKNKFTGRSSAPDGRNLPVDGGQLLMLAAVEMLWLHEEEARAKTESIKNVISSGRGVCCRNMWLRCSASAPYLHQSTINSQRCSQQHRRGQEGQVVTRATTRCLFLLESERLLRAFVLKQTKKRRSVQPNPRAAARARVYV